MFFGKSTSGLALQTNCENQTTTQYGPKKKTEGGNGKTILGKYVILFQKAAAHEGT
jgi:hypothetical protein